MYDSDEKIEKVSEELAFAFIKIWAFKESPEKLVQRFLHAKREIADTIRNTKDNLPDHVD